MGEWTVVVACASGVAFASGAAAAFFFWHKKTQAEAALENKIRENEQLRKDDAADLDRQARQYDSQIADLNGKLQAAQQRTDSALADVRRLESETKESKASLEAEKRRVEDMERHYRELLGQMKSEFKALSDDVLREKREQFEKEGLAGVTKFTDRDETIDKSKKTTVEVDLKEVNALQIDELVSGQRVLSPEVRQMLQEDPTATALSPRQLPVLIHGVAGQI